MADSCKYFCKIFSPNVILLIVGAIVLLLSGLFVLLSVSYHCRLRINSIQTLTLVLFQSGGHQEAEVREDQ